MLKKVGLLVIGAGLALSPAAALAKDHDSGRRGYSERGYSERGYSREGHEAQERAEHAYREAREHEYRGYRGRSYGGFSFGFSAPYSGYLPSYCGGYYDQWGNWVVDPYCYGY